MSTSGSKRLPSIDSATLRRQLDDGEVPRATLQLAADLDVPAARKALRTDAASRPPSLERWSSSLSDPHLRLRVVEVLADYAFRALTYLDPDTAHWEAAAAAVHIGNLSRATLSSGPKEVQAVVRYTRQLTGEEQLRAELRRGLLPPSWWR